MVLNYSKDFVFYTIQGEGKYTGVPSIFIRLSSCNLRCEWLIDNGKTNLCDTPYTSHHPETNKQDLDLVLKEVKKHPAKHIVITGGEPFYQKGVVELINILSSDYHITVETNGTIYLESKADFISISPKLSSSCHIGSRHYSMHEQNRYNKEALVRFINQHQVQLKYVVNVKEDIIEIKEQLKELEEATNKSLHDKVYLMPQGLTKKEVEEKSQWLIEIVKENNYKYCDRLHIRQWGPKRAK